MAKLNKITEEDKQLLFTDLCGRLPYSVYVQTKKFDFPVELRHLSLDNIPDIRPYLRRMTSMTEIENAYYKYHRRNAGEGIRYEGEQNLYDWLNSHHFDYRGLIDKGLAIEAKPEDDVYKLYKYIG